MKAWFFIQAWFYVWAGGNCLPNLGLSQMWRETLFYKLKASAYKCTKENSVAFKILQNAFPNLTGELTTLSRFLIGCWGHSSPSHYWWRFGAVGSDVGQINEVTLRRARLVLGSMGDRIGVQLLVREIYLSPTNHPGQLSLAIPPWVGAMSTGQRAVMLCDWGVKADMVLFAGNIVWSISERVRGVCVDALYKSTFTNVEFRVVKGTYGPHGQAKFHMCR